MKREIWILLFVLGVLFFSWPLMTIFHENIVSALFVIWIAFILLVFLVSKYSGRKDGS